MVNVSKLIQVVAYTLKKHGGSMNYTKLIKIIYLADRKALQLSGYSISSDKFVAMKNGMVLSGLYDLIKGVFHDKNAQTLWDSKFARDGYDIRQVCPFVPLGELCDFETEILDETDARFHNKTFGEMVDFIHNPQNCPEWRDTESSVAVSERSILSVLGFSDEQIDDLSAEKQSFQDEQKMIDALSDVCEVQN